MKKIKQVPIFLLLTLLIFFTTSAINAEQDLSVFVGEWSGAILIPGQKLGVDVQFEIEDNELVGKLDIPTQMAYDIVLENIKVDGDNISFIMAGIPGNPTFELTLSSDYFLEGTFLQGGQSFPAEMEKIAAAEAAAAKLEAAQKKEEQLEAIKELAEELLAYWQVPGLGLGIIKDGEIFLSEGFGYQDNLSQAAVDAQTLFAIGSSSKAFTTATVALMVEEGKLSWDSPVLDYLPWFRMADSYVTFNATLRDFALHRTGLARHDFSWYGRDIERLTFIENMKYLDLAIGFREGFIYNNYGYTLLGYLAGYVNDMEWEELLEERILNPLGMDNTFMAIEDLSTAENHAQPFQVRGGEIETMSYRNLDEMGPAGSIVSNVEDMLKWVKMFLNNGTYQGKQILAPASIAEMVRPQMALPVGGLPELRFSNYALGWMVEDYRGDVLIHHGGNIDGYSALVAMMPQQQLGIIALTNLNATALPLNITYQIIDIILERELIDWSARFGQEISMMPEDSIQPPRQIEGTNPSRQLEQYVGTYENPAYGQVRILWDSEKGLEFVFRGQKSSMKHWHYDVFVTRVLGMAVGLNLPVHFQTDLEGYITSLSLPIEPTLGLIEFKLVAGDELFKDEYLQFFSGVYQVMGIEFSIQAQAGQLAMEVPGQPASFLIPQRVNRFILEEIEGYSFDFEVENGEIIGLWLNQPNGSFFAEKLE